MNRRAKEALRQKLESYLYTVTWRGNAEQQTYSGTAGFTALATALGVKPKTLACYLATGRDQHSREMTNPLTGEPDVATVTRHKPAPKPKRPVGRPPKQYDSARLGTEFASPARTVPKGRNRVTGEKPTVPR